ncbi:MAG: hypothetical protein AB7F43_02625 [Bacteriovoracia bacterium]
MRSSKGSSSKANYVKTNIELEKELVEKLEVMESHTKISKGELVSTALKRFISQHKDYFPEDYSDK